MKINKLFKNIVIIIDDYFSIIIEVYSNIEVVMVINLKSFQLKLKLKLYMFFVFILDK